MTGFVGVHSFWLLADPLQTLPELALQAHSNVLIGSVLFWGLFMCIW